MPTGRQPSVKQCRCDICPSGVSRLILLLSLRLFHPCSTFGHIFVISMVSVLSTARVLKYFATCQIHFFRLLGLRNTEGKHSEITLDTET
jgi:hypothetical protein